MHNYLQELNIEYQNGHKKVVSRRNEWADFQDRAVELLKRIADTTNELANAGKYYEFAYVVTAEQLTNRTHTNRGVIQFHLGQHPVWGVSTTQTDVETRKVTSSGFVEKSGCLSIIQNPNGEVFFIIYPSSSDLVKWKDDYIVIKHFSTPSKIKYNHVKEAVEFYLRYTQITSYNCKPNLWDNIKMSWVKFHFTDLLKFIPKGFGMALRIAIAAHTGMPVK